MLIAHFGIWALLISIHDLRFRKIRRRDVYIAILSLIPWLHIQSIKVAIFNLAIYLILFVLSNGQIGFGDVRLSFLIGLYLGILNSNFKEVLVVNSLSWSVASFVVLGRWLCRLPIGALPFAPFMFLSVVISALIDTSDVI